MGGTFPAILCQVWNFDNKALICLIPNFAQLSAVFAVCRTVFLGQFKRLTLCVSIRSLVLVEGRTHEFYIRTHNYVDET